MIGNVSSTPACMRSIIYANRRSIVLLVNNFEEKLFMLISMKVAADPRIYIFFFSLQFSQMITCSMIKVLSMITRHLEAILSGLPNYSKWKKPSNCSELQLDNLPHGVQLVLRFHQ